MTLTDLLDVFGWFISSIWSLFTENYLPGTDITLSSFFLGFIIIVTFIFSISLIIRAKGGK